MSTPISNDSHNRTIIVLVLFILLVLICASID